MAGRKLTVVISQAPGKNPVKRQLEEDIATQLMLSGTAEVSVVPHLYDLTADHTGMLWLKSLKGDLVVLGWLYPRAIRWVLDRNGVKGHEGQTPLNDIDEGDDDHPEDEEAAATPPEAIGSVNVPNRLIYAVDLRGNPDPKVYITEIERLAKSTGEPLIQLSGLFGQSLAPTSNGHSNGHLAQVAPPNSNGTHGNGTAVPVTIGSITHGDQVPTPSAAPTVIGNTDVRRRWYPVIDYSRCTNCLECLDFCLFGVYGVDLLDRILVEQEDNCKKGCPACSRVCPANAIVFPEHKTPAIAGAAGVVVDDFKIDLSKLFGAPSALEMAVLERDVELVADGRDAVGATVGLPKRQSGQSAKPRDDLDDLMDNLDALDI